MAVLQCTTLLLSILGLALHQVQGQVAVARFNAKGISGYVKFTAIEGGDTRIEANFMGLRGDHRWHVHMLPVDQTVDPAVQCMGGYVGPHYDPFNKNNFTDYIARCMNDRTQCEAGDLSGKFGYLSINTPVNVVDNTSSLFLRGQYSIVGRSIVIHEHTPNFVNFECATIRSTDEGRGTEVTLLQATFISPMAGTIYFKQVQGEEVQMWGKIFWVNGSPDTVNHNWHIHRLAPGEEFRVGVCNTSVNILGHFRPLENGPPSIANYSDMCNPSLTSGCEVGDLTGKHATVNVMGSPSPYSAGAFFFTDNFLNLTGENAVINRSVAIHQVDRGGPVVACAQLIRSETISLMQHGVGEVVISQTSPFEDTSIVTTGTRSMTVIQKSAFSPLGLDCAAAPNQVFTPYMPVPEEGVKTPDQFPLGNLHTRYEDVNNAQSQNVFDVPVYGANVSITSLNLRTVRDSDSNCSALIPMLRGNNVIVAKATFTGNLRGAIYLVQKDFGYDQLGSTHVIMDVFRNSQQASVTNGHDWGVGSSPSNGCASTLTPYNPYSVSTSGSDCTPQAQLRCASGDLSGKHGQISLGPDNVDRSTYTFVDSNLVLTGSYTVLGNSVGVLATNGANLDCGTITRAYVSAQTVSFTTSRSNTSVRTMATTILAQEVSIDPSDILVLNQRAYQPFGLSCLEVTVRVLGTTQASADANANTLRTKAPGLFSCSGTLRSATISLATLILPLMVAFFQFLSKN